MPKPGIQPSQSFTSCNTYVAITAEGIEACYPSLVKLWEGSQTVAQIVTGITSFETIVM